MSPELRKVEALLAMGRPAEAALLAERLPERDAPTPEFLRVRGRAFRAAGRMVDAESSFREALALQPGDPGLAADLATTLAAQHRYRDALPFAREAVSLRPEVAAYHALVGFVADRLGYTAEARGALELARTLAPADAEAHSVLGFHLLRVGEPAAALEAFAAAIAADPRHAEAFRGLARARLQTGDWAGAQAAWSEALGVDPTLHDRAFELDLRRARPSLAPLRRLARLPAWVTLGFTAAGAGVCWASRALALGALIYAALLMLALASLPPLARRTLGALDG